MVTGHVLVKKFQPEAIVDALQQDAAEFHVALDDQHIFCTVLFCGDGGRQPARAAADKDDVVVGFHIRSSTDPVMASPPMMKTSKAVFSLISTPFITAFSVLSAALPLNGNDPHYPF